MMKSHKTLFAVTSFFLYVTCLTFSWVLIQPPYGVSDEPAHTIKAVASAYGQFDSPQAVGQFGYGAYKYEIPKVLTSIWHFTCYDSDTRVTAACIGDFPTGSELVETTSTAGPYPPTYYLSVGWPGRLVPSQTGFYLMRFLSALLFCLILTYTFWLQFLRSQSRNAWVSILLLLTPAVSSFSGVINPFAMEIAAAALFWTSAILLTDSRESNRESKYLWVALVISSLLFSIIRPAAFMWIAVSAFFVFFSSPKNGILVSRFKDKIVRSLVGIVFNAIVISIAITYRSRTDLEADAANTIKPLVSPGGDTFSNMLISYGNLGTFFRQFFGYFGWTSFYPPKVVPVLFMTALVLSLGLVTLTQWRMRAGLAALLSFVFFSPVVLEGARASHAGFFYQGRYLLPVAVGIPIYIWLRGTERKPNRMTPVLTTMIIALSAGSSIFTANYVARRFVSGTDGRLLWFFDVKWSPPGGAFVTLSLLVAATVFACLMAAVVVVDTEVRPKLEIVDSVQSH